MREAALSPPAIGHQRAGHAVMHVIKNMRVNANSCS